MSNEKQMLIVTWAQFLTPFVVAAGVGWMHFEIAGANAHSDAKIADLKQTITETYETQSAHAADISSVKTWVKDIQANQAALGQSQNDLKVGMQHLTDMVGSIN
jgi:hypothetical protein